MAVTQIRGTYDDEAPVMADSFGLFGWVAVFAIFAVALLLVAYL